MSPAMTTPIAALIWAAVSCARLWSRRLRQGMRFCSSFAVSGRTPAKFAVSGAVPTCFVEVAVCEVAGTFVERRVGARVEADEAPWPCAARGAIGLTLRDFFPMLPCHRCAAPTCPNARLMRSRADLLHQRPMIPCCSRSGSSLSANTGSVANALHAWEICTALPVWHTTAFPCPGAGSGRNAADVWAANTPNTPSCARDPAPVAPYVLHRAVRSRLRALRRGRWPPSILAVRSVPS